jgi:hypothetical protein
MEVLAMSVDVVNEALKWGGFDNDCSLALSRIRLRSKITCCYPRPWLFVNPSHEIPVP